eukprot:CAMPEP_0206163128 /NCGR_PEP_ID=MMETSP1474-20131121/11224_1 /ASSEMBLY_ACC=CAM_ASM_001110 /TAXON_ID=97495 /ORGANISM="Imantonia sp., Strain RCC918" /LENGTH=418 /DNA_ID=CAMNT_0053565559 /DNA_START=65 /DNA_END=1320 /DNA_ORIENTATION=-
MRPIRSGSLALSLRARCSRVLLKCGSQSSVQVGQQPLAYPSTAPDFQASSTPVTAAPLALPPAAAPGGSRRHASSRFEHRLEGEARREPPALLAEDVAKDDEPLRVRVCLEQRLELQPVRVALHRVELLSVASLDALDLLQQGRGQVLQPDLAPRVDDSLLDLVVLEELDHALLDLALHLLAHHRSPLLQELLPQHNRAPQPLVVSARADLERQPVLHGLREARLLAQLGLRVDDLEEEPLGRALRLVRVLALLLPKHLDLGAQIGLARRRNRRVQHVEELDAPDDRVLPNVLDSVLRLLRHLFQLVQIEDDAHLSQSSRLRLNVGHHEATSSREEDIVEHLAVARLKDVEHGVGVREEVAPRGKSGITVASAEDGSESASVGSMAETKRSGFAASPSTIIKWGRPRTAARRPAIDPT